MSFGCLMITTNRSDRWDRTIAAINSVEQFSDKFDQKVLSIDLLPEVEKGCEKALEEYFAPQGWKVVTGNCTGYRAMQNNILRGLEDIDTEYLFYCEDHVIIEDVPQFDDIKSIFDPRFGNAGWINYNTHVHEENLLNVPGFIEKSGRKEKLNWINKPDIWIRKDSGEFLPKGLPVQDEYILNFPAIITKTEIYENLLSYGMGHYKDIGIEIGFSQAWYDSGYSDRKNVFILTKPGTWEKLPFNSFQDLHNQACMRFRNNDPSMLHKSIIAHSSMPKEKGLRRSFF